VASQAPRRSILSRAALSPRALLAPALVLGPAAWLLGSSLLVLRLAIGQRRLSRLRSSAVPAEPAAESLCRDIARRMRLEAPEVLRSPLLFSPCVDGLRRPAILLPEDVGANLRETFVHELAHLARRDGLWNFLRQCSVAALWVQPLLWALSRRLEATAEEVCDDHVVQFGGDRARYAGHLLDLAGRGLAPAAPVGVGMVSLRSLLARRIVRILDPSRPLSTQAGTRAVLATLAAGLAGTILAGLLGVGGAKQEARAQAPAKAAPGVPVRDDDVLRGQVTGPDGIPVAGATVVAARGRRILDGIGDEYSDERRYESLRTVADAQGRFALAFESGEFRANAQILATAEGFGLGYYLKGRPLRLSAGDQPIEGRLVDLEGRPVAGVTVRLGQVWVPAPEIALEVASPEKPGSTAGKLGLDATPLLPDGIVTDADGRFRIAGLGRDVLARLTLSGPTIALKRVRVLTRAMGRIAEAPRDAAFVGLDEPAIHGARCTIAVEPTRPIDGTVRDAETGAPIPGATVTAAALSGSELMLDGLISAETDSWGRYRLVGLPKEGVKGHKLAVYPPLDRPYFITRRIEAPARPGLDPVEFNIALRRGIWITGKVTDVATGKSVSAAVDYFPFLANAHARDYPNFDPDITASLAIKTRYKTDDEGRFRVVGLPGRGVVTAHTDDRGYRVGVGAESIEGRDERHQLPTYDRISPIANASWARF
jgi:beta-lactamase regulating signal transducer with metallopeptidase domain